MAYVYIQHLDPTHESKLSEILGRATKMNVMEATHQVTIEPNHVYIIPPDQDMSVKDGMLTLNQRTGKSNQHQGHLMLGRSETIGTSGQLFTQIEKKYKIYARRKDATATQFLVEPNYRLPETEKAGAAPSRTAVRKEEKKGDGLEALVDNILLSEFTSASVVVDQVLEILQFRGSTGLFLEPSLGKASLNLLKMAKPGLAFELPNAIHKAGKSGERIKKTGLKIRDRGTTRQVSIEVLPFQSEDEEKLFLVIFEELPISGPPSGKPSLRRTNW